MAITETTKTRALKEARSLLQTYGFNGFSFQHIADAIGIKKPSLYVHFDSKEELGRDLIEDYLSTFSAWMETVSVFGPADKVGALFENFFKFSCNDRKFCPLVALMNDYNSLPESMQKALIKVFKMQQKWLKETIEDGQKSKIFRRDLTSENLAQSVMAMAFGAQQIARLLGQPERIKSLKTDALRMLEK